MGLLDGKIKRYELACNCGCGFDTVDAELIEVLYAVRFWAGAPVHPTNGCRCYRENLRVTKNPDSRSQHMRGRACDFYVEGKTPNEVQAFLLKKYPRKYGIGRYDSFTHIDTKSGPRRRWDKRKNAL